MESIFSEFVGLEAGSRGRGEQVERVRVVIILVQEAKGKEEGEVKRYTSEG